MYKYLLPKLYIAFTYRETSGLILIILLFRAINLSLYTYIISRSNQTAFIIFKFSNYLDIDMCIDLNLCTKCCFFYYA